MNYKKTTNKKYSLIFLNTQRCWQNYIIPIYFDTNFPISQFWVKN